MGLLVVGIIVLGFSFTFREGLANPTYPHPAVLYFHIAAFSAWLALFITQSWLVSARRADVHRKIGPWGLALGAALPFLGIATAISMTRAHVAHGEVEVADSFLIPVWDMIAYTTAFILAVKWRRRPDYHRRAMWIATCALTAAAWGRMPWLDHAEWFYTGVDALILIALVRDLVVTGSVHPVFRYGLPMIVIGQFVLAWVRWSPWWLHMAPTLFK